MKKCLRSVSYFMLEKIEFNFKTCFKSNFLQIEISLNQKGYRSEFPHGLLLGLMLKCLHIYYSVQWFTINKERNLYGRVTHQGCDFNYTCTDFILGLTKLRHCNSLYWLYLRLQNRNIHSTSLDLTSFGSSLITLSIVLL